MAEPHCPAIFKWWHFTPEIILCAVRWHLCFCLSYRGVQELLIEQGLEVDHTTVWQLVQRDVPILDERTRIHLTPPTNSGAWTRPMSSSRVVGSICTEPSTRWEPRSTSSYRRFDPPILRRRRLPRHRQILLIPSRGWSIPIKRSAIRLRSQSLRKKVCFNRAAVSDEFNV